MKMYSKKLKSLEALRREKQVLKYAKKHTASEELFSPEQFMPKKKDIPSEGTTNTMAVIGDLLTSKSAVDVAMTLGIPLLKMGGIKAGKGIFKVVGKELIGGYLKWKLISFGLKAVTGMVREKRKNKREYNNR